jgi:hypothetical protein
MYNSLKTNLSKQIMGFTDFPFKETTENFPTAKIVSEYLEDYAKHFNLTKKIKLESKVTKIELNGDKWDVEVNNEEIEQFDGVVICSGHYSEPFIPNISGLKEFENKIHSKNYKEPSMFKEKSVLVMGTGPSGSEISLELVKNGSSKVYFSGSDHFPTNYDIIQKSFVKKVHSDGTIDFENDEESCKIDWIILATGYLYTFPFIQSNLIKIIKKDVYPLYQHIFHCDFPSLSFVGLNQRLVPFYIFDYQSKFISQVYSKNIELPSCQEMKQKTDQYWKMKNEQGIPIHTLADEQWAYIQEIEDFIHSKEKSNPLIQKTYDLIGIFRKQNFDDFRNLSDEKVSELWSTMTDQKE